MQSQKNPGTYSLWKGSSLAKRLNIVGTVTCILDTSIHLASSRSSAINDFFSNTIPYYVSAAYYILPSASLLLVYFKNLYTTGCTGNACTHDDSTQKAQALVDELYEVDGFQEFIAKNPQAQETLLTKVKEMQQNGWIDKIDIFINILYFTLRALQGGVLILKAHELSSNNTSRAITDWSDFISTVINVAYLTTMLIHNNIQKHNNADNKHTLFSQPKIQPSQQEPNTIESSSEKNPLLLNV